MTQRSKKARISAMRDTGVPDVATLCLWREWDCALLRNVPRLSR
jgi:hypothetical protein